MSGGNYSGNNRRGGLPIPQHAHPLVRIFLARMNEERATYREVARRTSVGIDTMRFWPKRHIPRVDTLDAALNALDLELCIRDRATGRVLSDPLAGVQS